MLNSTTAAFKQVHHAAIKVQVHFESLGCDVERRFVILQNYACCTLLELSALHDVKSLEGSFTNLLSIVLPQLNSHCFELLFGRLFGVLCSMSSEILL